MKLREVLGTVIGIRNFLQFLGAPMKHGNLLENVLQFLKTYIYKGIWQQQHIRGASKVLFRFKKITAFNAPLVKFKLIQL